eukprot:CAMPEP_0176128926 /NCGR_PEP_ID=MMETSP0120_2-20121206/65168_1 /TAXON_ID=160619 /ORGANISM="Kryptoperidinium foliaceum, Strain CCMP 1326" /LENGTH=64 /DNA_ID=CAMNT_0017464069 /DNA_START=71 /DNA_END=261 /DNA_ORIENTATION=+
MEPTSRGHAARTLPLAAADAPEHGCTALPSIKCRARQLCRAEQREPFATNALWPAVRGLAQGGT